MRCLSYENILHKLSFGETMKSYIQKISFIIFSVQLFVGCGPDLRDHEYYGDLSAPGAIVLSDSRRHAAGWGRKDCLLCHNAELNLHQSPQSNINVEALNQAIINGGESQYCQTCHGRNGIEQ